MHVRSNRWEDGVRDYAEAFLPVRVTVESVTIESATIAIAASELSCERR